MMEHPLLWGSWHDLGGSPITTGRSWVEVRRDIQRMYQNPLRHYHNLDHIESCLAILAWWERVTGQKASAQVRLALILHDVVYDARSKQNEEDSAAFANLIDWSRKTGDIIIGTKHAGDPLSEDEALVRDCDLSGLGALPGVYDAATSRIRLEFAFFEDGLWRRGRKDFLRLMLDKEVIFFHADMRSQFEAQARTNMRNELAKLEELDFR